MTTTKKYQSTIISCLLHGALVIMLLDQQRRSPVLASTPHEPAKVHIRPLPAEPITPVSASAHSVPQSTLSSPQKEPQEDTSRSSLPPNAIEQINRLQAVYSPSTRTESLSRESFIKAFSSALQKVRQETSPHQQAPFTSGPIHVQERLKEWTDEHFRTKVINEIRRAGRLTSKYLTNQSAFHKTVYAHITLNKDGTLKSVNKQLSGIDEVDDYLLKIINMTDFPPIPERFHADTYAFSIPIQVNLREGSDRYYFY